MLKPDHSPTSPSSSLERTSPDTLAGWGLFNAEPAFAAFQRSCREMQERGRTFDRAPLYAGEAADWHEVCALALAGTSDYRAFFADNFMAFRVNDPQRPDGLFTGYFEPEMEGRRERTAGFDVPVYGVPDDLVRLDAQAEERLGLRYGRKVDGVAQGYFTRAEIENGALAGRGLELFWVRDPADAFFMQVQGSGRIRLGDGSVARLAYGGKTGLPYTGIGGILVERGILTPDTVSMQSIRNWMVDHPHEARLLMQENRSFVFFRELHGANPAEGPIGAQKVPLTPRVSLAIDRRIWAFGTPFWIDTIAPTGPGHGSQPFRALMIAQDTGSAIVGAARGDVFWGSGARAGEIAGPMKSSGTMVVWLPNAVAARLGKSSL